MTYEQCVRRDGTHFEHMLYRRIYICIVLTTACYNYIQNFLSTFVISVTFVLPHTIFIEFRTVQGGGLGLGETWLAARQVSVWATAVESVYLYLSYGIEGCARVKSKIVLFLGDKLFIIIIRVEYTLEQRIFLYDAYVKYSSTGRCRRKFQHQFAGVRIPSKSTNHDLVNKVKRTRSFLNKERV